MSTSPVARARLDRDRLFEDLAYHPHAGQLLVHRSRALRRVLASGTRWGKSTCAAMEIVAGLLEPRDATMAWLVAPSYELTHRVWLRVVQVFQEKLPYRVQAVLPRELRIIVTNLGGGTSELRGKSADQPSGLLGESLTFVVADEAGRLREDIWSNHLMPRLIDQRGWSLLISTPEGPGWFYEEFRRGQRNRDPDYQSWATPSWTNPHVSREVIEAERKRLGKDDFRRQFEAEFIGVPAEPCLACGGPRSDVTGTITTERDQRLPRCAGCGLFTDEAGRCIVRRRGSAYSWLHIDRPWTEPESALMYEWIVLDADGKYD